MLLSLLGIIHNLKKDTRDGLTVFLKRLISSGCLSDVFSKMLVLFFRRTGFGFRNINDSTVVFVAIEFFKRSMGIFEMNHFDKAKAFTTTGLAIDNDERGLYRATVGKQFPTLYGYLNRVGYQQTISLIPYALLANKVYILFRLAIVDGGSTPAGVRDKGSGLTKL